MNTTKWFDRQFDFSFGTDQYEALHARLKASAQHLSDSLRGVPEERLITKAGDKWSLKEHAGHLSILEPLWRIRFQDIHNSRPELMPADLQNKATTQAGFNNEAAAVLVKRFTDERSKTLFLLESLDARDGRKASLHPRLQQRMRIVDLMYFVAEHDDHHISHIIRTLASG